jgi:hypothetical protein
MLPPRARTGFDDDGFAKPPGKAIGHNAGDRVGVAAGTESVRQRDQTGRIVVVRIGAKIYERAKKKGCYGRDRLRDSHARSSIIV